MQVKSEEKTRKETIKEQPAEKAKETKTESKAKTVTKTKPRRGRSRNTETFEYEYNEVPVANDILVEVEDNEDFDD